MTKTKLLMGASALLAATMALAGSASANGNSTTIHGGGSSLIAPDIIQAGYCFAQPTYEVIQGSVLHNQAGPPPVAANEVVLNGAAGASNQALVVFNYLGKPAYNCNKNTNDTTDTVDYISTGSGTGVNGFLSHDATTFWGDTVPGTDPSNYPSVEFANSDYGLAAADLTAYSRTGGVDGSVTTVAYGATPGAGQYGNPTQLYGANIQLPILLVPVALAYSPVYKIDKTGPSEVDYKFNVTTQTFAVGGVHPNSDGSGGLRLDVPTTCAIFNGQIKYWSDPALTALNGGVSLKDPSDPGTEFATLPIEIVGRADSSGTNTIFYRALAAQCGTGSVTYKEGGDNITYTNQYLAAGSKKTPTGLQGATYVTGNPTNGPTGNLGTLGKYTLATLTSGEAEYTYFDPTQVPAGQIYTQGRLAYVSPDYALPAVTNSAANLYGLNVVDIVTGAKFTSNVLSAGVTVEPTGANALKAFPTTYLPPQSTSTGLYSSGVATFGVRSAPQDWAEPFSTTYTYSNGQPGVSLANPGAKVYPFVGTSNIDLYSCYANAAKAATVRSFVTYYLASVVTSTVAKTPSTTGLLAYNGFSPMPTAWLTAMYNTFLTTNSSVSINNGILKNLPFKALPTDANASPLGLYISTAGDSTTQCSTVTPGA